NLRLARDNEENRRPLNTLIAFRMLDHLNWAAFREDPDHFDLGSSAESLKVHLRPDTEAFLAEAITWISCSEPDLPRRQSVWRLTHRDAFRRRSTQAGWPERCNRCLRP